MRERSCSRCGREMPPGELAYVAEVRVFCDFDGVIGEAEQANDQQLQQLLKQIERSDPEELEKEVYEEVNLLLCKSCRDRFVREVQHPWEGPFSSGKAPGKIFH